MGEGRTLHRHSQGVGKRKMVADEEKDFFGPEQRESYDVGQVLSGGTDKWSARMWCRNHVEKR